MMRGFTALSLAGMLLFVLLAAGVVAAQSHDAGISKATTLTMSGVDVHELGRGAFTVPLVGDYDVVIKMRTVSSAKLPIRCDVSKKVCNSINLKKRDI